MTAPEARPPFPPFTLETARQKVRAAEDGWNSRNPLWAFDASRIAVRFAYEWHGDSESWFRS